MGMSNLCPWCQSPIKWFRPPPKWDPRSRLGIYVGRSPFHAGNVALVLNPQTGHISPQYHVVFDDTFSTVPFLRSGEEPPNWVELVRTSSEKVTTEAYEVADHWNQAENAESEDQNLPSEGDSEITDPSSPLSRDSTSQWGSSSSSRDDEQNDLPSTSQRGSTSHMPKMVDLSTSGLRRSKRNHKAPNRFGFFSKFCLLSMAALSMHRSTSPASFISRTMNQFEKVNLNFDGTSNSLMLLPSLHLSLIMNRTLSKRC